jgi:hypothetical protein
MPGLQLVLTLAIEVDIALVQMQMVTWNPDHPLDQEHIGITGLQEDDDVAAMHGAITHKGRPVRRRRQIHAVDQDMVADEQSLLHRAGGDDEVLKDEGEDEEAYHDDGAVRCQGLERGLVMPRGARCGVVRRRRVCDYGGRIRCRLGHRCLL